MAAVGKHRLVHLVVHAHGEAVFEFGGQRGLRGGLGKLEEIEGAVRLGRGETAVVERHILGHAIEQCGGDLLALGDQIDRGLGHDGRRHGASSGRNASRRRHSPRRCRP